MTGEQTIFDRIKAKADRMTPKLQQLAEYLISNYKVAAFETVAGMAKQAGVSEATVVRLADALDYRGFSEMLEDLQRVLRHELEAFEHIRHTYSGKELRNLDAIQAVVSNEQANIARFPENVRVEEVRRVVDTVAEADKTIVIGLYAEAYLAQYFGYNFGKVRENVVIVNQDNADLFNLLLSCTERTVVFIFAFPRYLHRAQEIGEAFRKEGAAIIGISDSVASPLRAVSHQFLLIPQKYTSFSDPSCAFLLLLQAIIVEYMARSPAESEHRLAEFDERAKFLDVLK
ncbi:MAG: MurR/RpiR family transcriptional regulator [Spirochaetaceae bacterium]